MSQHRLVSLDGGQNFRDLGGYEAADGRRVRWNQIYRSGSMARLTDGDFERLRTLGIKSVIDLRSTREREREPVHWPSPDAPLVLQEDYTLDVSLLLSPLAEGEVTYERALAATTGFCAELPYRFAHRYRELFAVLLAGATPVIFNCSAGKDRTGVAAALILTTLGVPREVIIEDYLLSNLHFDPGKTLATDADADARWRRLPPELEKVVMSVHAGALEAAFAAIERRSGGLEAYLADELGVSTGDVAKLQATYLK